MGRNIQVRAGTKNAPLHIKRPAWSDMIKHYKTIPSNEFYPIISKKWVENVNSPDPDVRITWENTCAGRMSYALNHSGFILPKNPEGAFIGDNDKFNHWFRVSELREYLKKKFGKGDIEYSLIQFKQTPLSQDIWNERVSGVEENVLSKIKGKNGIVVFQVSGWGNASGHFTLWNGSKLLYANGHDDPNSYLYYFWFVQSSNEKIKQTNKIIFWELK